MPFMIFQRPTYRPQWVSVARLLALPEDGMILVHYCRAVWTEEAATELREGGGGVTCGQATVGKWIK